MDAQMPKTLDVRCEPVRQFLKGFNSEATKESYSKKLSQFLHRCGMTPDHLLAEGYFCKLVKYRCNMFSLMVYLSS